MLTDRLLDLWNKNLGTLPGSVWNDTGITVLILAGNALTALPAQIGQLQHLRTLDLGHNELSRLPEELGKLVQLRDFLYLHDNLLDSLPQSLEGLRKLRYLNISQDRFSVFPVVACHMQSLVELRATDNQLSDLPSFYCIAIAAARIASQEQQNSHIGSCYRRPDGAPPH